MGDIIKLSALALGEKIRRGEIKIAEVLDAVYKSEEENRRLNCFITLCRERAYEKGAARRGRVHFPACGRADRHKGQYRGRGS